MDWTTIAAALLVQLVAFVAVQLWSMSGLKRDVRNLGDWLKAHEHRDEQTFSRLDGDVREVRAVVLRPRDG
jgi:hypothetical protein